jgi:hypothetical protein
MLPSLSNKLLFIAAIQAFVRIGANAASDFHHAFPNRDNFRDWSSFSLGGALMQAGADERTSPTERDGRHRISQLLLRPGNPGLAINFDQTSELPDMFSTFDASVKLQRGQNTIISGEPGETVVLSLRNFVLSRDAIFTLEGTATTTFVINVTKRFSLSGNTQVNLVGVQWNNVLFNIQGAGGVISLSGNASLSGILIANGRTVRLSGNSTIYGEVRGERLQLGGSSRVIPPPLASP